MADARGEGGDDGGGTSSLRSIAFSSEIVGVERKSSPGAGEVT